MIKQIKKKVTKYQERKQLEGIHLNKIDTVEQTQRNKVVTILKKNYSQPIIVSSRVQTQHKRSSQIDRLSKPDTRTKLQSGCWRGKHKTNKSRFSIKCT